MRSVFSKVLFLFLIATINLKQLNTIFLLQLVLVMILFLIQILKPKKIVQNSILGLFAILSIWRPDFIKTMPLLYASPFSAPTYLLFIFPLATMDVVTALLFLMSILFTYVNDLYIELQEQHKKVRDDLAERNLILNETVQQAQKQQLTAEQMIVMEERNRISSELHDAIGHTITSSLLQIEAIKLINKDEKLEKPLQTVGDKLSEGMTEIRSVIHNMKRDALSVEREIEKFFANTSLTYHMTIHDEEMDMERKFLVLNIIKEAITNTIKHSDANQMDIELHSHPAFDALRIKDNGSKPVDISKLKYGMGLSRLQDTVYNNDGVIQFSYHEGFQIYITLMKEEQ